MTTVPTDRIRRSVKLTADEYRSLVKWVDNQLTKFDAALILGITRPTLDRILHSKKGAHESIEKIRKVLGTA
jgi:predicted DNA-binding protein (UPF0251 family)